MLVTSALNSLRGAVSSINIFSESFNGCTPAYTTIQNWILQYGVYELLKPVEKRDDWIYVLDHTIEFGNQKCLVVLGITLERFMKNKCVIRHEDMDVLKLEISSESNSSQILKVLECVSKNTGVPIQIISDHGPSIKKATNLFCANHKKTLLSYDITHKCAILLKHELQNDKRWIDFINECAKVKRKILNADLGFLAPPNARDKSRWQNMDTYINWAKNVIEYRTKIKEMKNKSRRKKKDYLNKYDFYFSWMNDYISDLDEWSQVFSILTLAKNEVKTNGLQNDTALNFQKKACEIQHPSKRFRNIKSNLTHFLNEETKEIPNGEKWLGTSDIIESIFGKYKIFSSRTTMKGIGKVILTIPVFTSTITVEKIKTAMETISINTLSKWINENIGQSFFSKRKQAFS